MKTNNVYTYNNEFRWNYVLRIIGLTMVLTLLMMASWKLLEWIFRSDINSYIEIGLLIGFVISTLSVLSVQFLPKICTGEYCIIGENLIVHEHYYHSSIDLNIPISCISDAKLTSYYNYNKKRRTEGLSPIFVPFQFIEITIDNQTYVLYCTTYVEKLYKELCKRIENNSNI